MADTHLYYVDVDVMGSLSLRVEATSLTAARRRARRYFTDATDYTDGTDESYDTAVPISNYVATGKPHVRHVLQIDEGGS